MIPIKIIAMPICDTAPPESWKLALVTSFNKMEKLLKNAETIYKKAEEVFKEEQKK